MSKCEEMHSLHSAGKIQFIVL